MQGLPTSKLTFRSPIIIQATGTNPKDQLGTESKYHENGYHNDEVRNFYSFFLKFYGLGPPAVFYPELTSETTNP
jgi:hypothetical protein